MNHECLIVFLHAVIDCGSLGNPEGGEVTITGGLARGAEAGVDAEATYSCDVGYDLVGEALRTCQATGLWDGAMPSCLCKLEKTRQYTNTTLYSSFQKVIQHAIIMK